MESSLFAQTNLFAEIGYKRSLLKNRVSLIATHSVQWGDTSAHISRLGLQYARQTGTMQACMPAIVMLGSLLVFLGTKRRMLIKYHLPVVHGKCALLLRLVSISADIL